MIQNGVKTALTNVQRVVRKRLQLPRTVILVGDRLTSINLDLIAIMHQVVQMVHMRMMVQNGVKIALSNVQLAVANPNAMNPRYQFKRTEVEIEIELLR